MVALVVLMVAAEGASVAVVEDSGGLHAALSRLHCCSLILGFVCHVGVEVEAVRRLYGVADD